MRGLTSREKGLLVFCLVVIFVVGNFFVIRAVMKTLGGSDRRIADLKAQLADYQMWTDEVEAQKADARNLWLRANMPKIAGSTLGKEQGDLLQSLQDELFERKLKIDQQSLQDPVLSEFYTEVSVRLRISGSEKAMIDWLVGLQSPKKFQVIKAIEIEPNRKSKEEEPQAICQITIARWFVPDGQEESDDDVVAPTEEATTPPPATDQTGLNERGNRVASRSKQGLVEE